MYNKVLDENPFLSLVLLNTFPTKNRTLLKVFLQTDMFKIYKQGQKSSKRTLFKKMWKKLDIIFGNFCGNLFSQNLLTSKKLKILCILKSFNILYPYSTPFSKYKITFVVKIPQISNEIFYSLVL